MSNLSTAIKHKISLCDLVHKKNIGVASNEELEELRQRVLVLKQKIRDTP
jgi:polyhydroxyalkanoate synthesis regulator phasin